MYSYLVLMRLSRKKTAWAAYCDACLIGSFVFEHPDHVVARAWAIEKLRAFGWTHSVPRDVLPTARPAVESGWMGETFCFECSRSAGMKRSAAG